MREIKFEHTISDDYSIDKYKCFWVYIDRNWISLKGYHEIYRNNIKEIEIIYHINNV